MNHDPQQLIQSLLRSEMMRQQHDAGKDEQPPCTITVSRQSGALGRTFAQMLADRLGLRYYDKALVEAMAQLAGVDVKVFEALDESARALRSNWLELLFTDKPLQEQRYLRTLVDVVIGIYRSGGVIVGRGANFILDGMPALRIRIVGSITARAARYAEEHGIDEEAAARAIESIDQDRARFVEKQFGKDLADPVAYDLVMNSDRLAVETMVDMAIDALRAGKSCQMGQGATGS